MHASIVTLVALVASANAYAYNYTAPAPVYTTEVVTELTTVCAGPTGKFPLINDVRN